MSQNSSVVKIFMPEGLRNGIAFMLFVMTSPLPAYELATGSTGAACFQHMPLVELYLLSAAGGALSFYVFTKSMQFRLWAMLPGALAGSCAFAVARLYPNACGLGSVGPVDFWMATLLGALPGMIIYGKIVAGKWKLVAVKK